MSLERILNIQKNNIHNIKYEFIKTFIQKTNDNSEIINVHEWKLKLLTEDIDFALATITEDCDPNYINPQYVDYKFEIKCLLHPFNESGMDNDLEFVKNYIENYFYVNLYAYMMIKKGHENKIWRERVFNEDGTFKRNQVL